MQCLNRQLKYDIMKIVLKIESTENAGQILSKIVSEIEKTCWICGFGVLNLKNYDQ